MCIRDSVGFDRTIVTDMAGTTRDTVEEKATVGGVLLRLIDTAGLHETEMCIRDRIGVGVPTLRDIVSELLKPGRDVRAELPKPILRTDVLEMKDLKPGMVLTLSLIHIWFDFLRAYPCPDDAAGGSLLTDDLCHARAGKRPCYICLLYTSPCRKRSRIRS